MAAVLPRSIPIVAAYDTLLVNWSLVSWGDTDEAISSRDVRRRVSPSWHAAATRLRSLETTRASGRIERLRPPGSSSGLLDSSPPVTP